MLLWLSAPDLAAFWLFFMQLQMYDQASALALHMQNFTSRDEVTRWTLQPVIFWGVGLIASLSAARCNCSLNNHLSGVASLPFSTGLHSVLSDSEASPTRTVAFLCLPGQLHQPLHQGWLLETFLSQSYIRPMWSRPVSWTLTEAGKQEESPCCLTTRLFNSDQLITSHTLCP